MAQDKKEPPISGVRNHRASQVTLPGVYSIVRSLIAVSGQAAWMSTNLMQRIQSAMLIGIFYATIGL